MATRKSVKEFLNVPLIQQQIDAAGDLVGRFAAEAFSVALWQRMYDSSAEDGHVLEFESPLEVAFWIWWSACAAGNHFYPHSCVVLERQRPVEIDGERFRLDFVVGLHAPEWDRAIKAGWMKWPKIAVEVDGHAFHERTPEQVAVRDRRDRLLQQHGWRVFHFSYSEFTREPERCVLEVYDRAVETAIELHRQYSLDVPAEFKD